MGSDNYSPDRLVHLRVPIHPHPINAPQTHTVFLEEEVHWRERRVMSLKMRFRKLSERRENECYIKNKQTLKDSSIKKRILISHL